MLFFQDGKTASISVVSRGSQVTISTNGKPDASIEMDPARPPVLDEVTMIMAGTLPLGYKPDARRVANIGLGSGLTTHTLLGNPSIERVDTVEIEAAITVGAHAFGDRVARTFNDPRSTIHFEDAKTFFAQQKQAYDVIVAEPSNPWVSGVSSLFSEEFYRTIGNYLTEDGVFVQWLQLYEFNDDLVLSVVKGLSRHFTDYHIYNTDNLDILIIAKRSGRLPEPSFDRLFAGPLAAELARVGLKGPDDLRVRKTGSRAVLDALMADARVPANSDYFPFLDLNTGKARFNANTSILFQGWSSVPLPLLDMLNIGNVNYRAVTADDAFLRTELIRNAQAHLSALRDATPSDTQGRRGDTPATDWLRALHASCGAGFEQAWGDALHALARETLAYLDPDAGAELLTAAAPPACRDRLPLETRQWIDLYTAIAARDGHTMAEIAEQLIDQTAATDRKQFALTAAMLGRLATHESEHVLDLYDKHKDLVGDLRTSPEIRLMLALARKGQTVDTTETAHSLL